MAIQQTSVAPAGERLLDAITIDYGPRELLSRLFLAADREVRDRGIWLYLRHDFDALLQVNLEEIEKGNWYRLPPMFDPRFVDVGAHNAFWIAGVNDAGEIVVTQAARVYDWWDSSLRDEARELFYEGQAHDLPCLVEIEDAGRVRGRVCYSGSTWFHPDYRRLGMSRLLPRISRAYAAAHFGADWTISLVQKHQVEMNIAHAYGYTDVKYAIRYPGSPWGDLFFALVRMQALELVRDAEDFVASREAA